MYFIFQRQDFCSQVNNYLIYFTSKGIFLNVKITGHMKFHRDFFFLLLTIKSIFSSLDHKLLVLKYLLNGYTEWMSCDFINHFPTSKHLKYSHNVSKEWTCG